MHIKRVTLTRKRNWWMGEFSIFYCLLKLRNTDLFAVKTNDEEDHKKKHPICWERDPYGLRTCTELVARRMVSSRVPRVISLYRPLLDRVPLCV